MFRTYTSRIWLVRSIFILIAFAIACFFWAPLEILIAIALLSVACVLIVGAMFFFTITIPDWYDGIKEAIWAWINAGEDS